MDARLRRLVRERAKNRCEYCDLRQEQEPLVFHIEHIVPRQHGGTDTGPNLALACHHCNFHKGTNLAGFDLATSKLTRLFHPRKDNWKDHFVRRAGEIIGVTAIGRVTVALLRMNQDGRLELREGR